jgi:hypothetical protein
MFQDEDVFKPWPSMLVHGNLPPVRCSKPAGHGLELAVLKGTFTHCINIVILATSYRRPRVYVVSHMFISSDPFLPMGGTTDLLWLDPIRSSFLGTIAITV